MKIQDVLESRKEDERHELLQRHSELMREIRIKSKKKVDFGDKSKNAKDKNDAAAKDSHEYTESLDKLRALSIAARIARGEDISRAQVDFLNFNYPEMMNDASIIKNKIQNAFKLLDQTSSRKDAEKMLQKIDSKILTMPYGNADATVFDKAVEIISKKP